MTYNALKSILVLLGFLIATGLFLWKGYRLLWVNLRGGQPSGRFDRWGERIKGLLVYVGAQLRLFRVLIPGTGHFFIFWGFLFLSLTILQAIVEGLVAFANPDFVLPVIGTFGPLIWVQDLLATLVIVAIA